MVEAMVAVTAEDGAGTVKDFSHIKYRARAPFWGSLLLGKEFTVDRQRNLTTDIF